MDENSAIIEAILREDEKEAEKHGRGERKDDPYAWQTVSYQKRQRKPSKPQPDVAADLRNGRPNGSAVSDIFRSIEQHSEERRRKALEAQMAVDADTESAVAGSKRHSDEDGDSDEEVSEVQNGVGGETKKVKVKKPKKPKVTVAEAASKIDAVDLGVFLADITVSHRLLQIFLKNLIFLCFPIDLLVYY